MMFHSVNRKAVKLDKYELNTLINGLYQHSDQYGDISDFLLRLIDESEKLKANRRKKLSFEPVEIKVVRACLLDWRNEQIQAKKEGAVDAISELLCKFI